MLILALEISFRFVPQHNQYNQVQQCTVQRSTVIHIVHYALTYSSSTAAKHPAVSYNPRPFVATQPVSTPLNHLPTPPPTPTPGTMSVVRRRAATLAPLLLTLHTLLHAPAPTLCSTAQSFIKPVSLVRQSSQNLPNCDCTCSLDDPKANPPCAGAPDGCLIARCAPRTDGYACCDGITTPTSLVTVADVRRQFEIIDEVAEEAVAAEPELSQAQVDILDACIGDLLELAKEDDGVTVVSRQKLSDAERRRAQALFRLVRNQSTRVLRSVVSRLRRQIALRRLGRN
eukprot:GFKZ01015721.1.p1 GENE.GFKZ01015721.1~~GFKZ01015721.1.p1  ORF type:complete len:286 (+),score=13.16 GFKZ01015721.1:145-1002(+)